MCVWVVSCHVCHVCVGRFLQMCVSVVSDGNVHAQHIKTGFGALVRRIGTEMVTNEERSADMVQVSHASFSFFLSLSSSLPPSLSLSLSRMG